MAKGQQRSSKEARKPKKAKVQDHRRAAFAKGRRARAGEPQEQLTRRLRLGNGTERAVDRS